MIFDSNQEVFRINSLTKAYGEGSAYNEVVKDIDLTVHAGEYLVILGPSGSGKSTLLYLLAGLETPSKGQILVRGENLADYSTNKLATFHRLTVGIVYQSFHLLPSFTILENVSFPLSLHGLRLKKRQERAMEVLARFGLDALANHYPSQISGGQQQKAAIARAMINTPPILLVDEPTGNLDTESAEEVMALLNLLYKQGRRTIILVSHNPEFVKFSTRTIHIVDGKIYQKPTDIPVSADYLSVQAKLMEQVRDLKHKEDIGVRNPFER